MTDYNGGNVIAHIGADTSNYQSAMRGVASVTKSTVNSVVSDSNRASAALDGAFQDKNGRWREANGRFVTSSQRLKELGDEANNTGSKFSVMAGSANQAFASIGKTLAVTGAAITAIGVKSLNGFGGFQQSLNQAAVIAGGTAKDIQGLADVANKMGADLPLSAKDAADAMVAMARDGASIGTIKAEFPAIAQAATAAGSDLQQTASIVQQSMNLWGSSLQSPARAAAILTQTANASNATVEDMQQVLADVGGTAQSVGYSMQDVATSVGLLTNRGIPAAQAAQNMNFALTRMIKPSAQARDVMNQLGLTYYDSAGKMKPINQVAGELNQKLAGLTDQQKQNALSLLFGQAGYKVMNGLMQSVADTTGNATTSWDGMSKAIESASSTGEVATKFLQDQANEMQKNLGSKLEQVGGNWESLRNAAMAGSSGVLGSMADMISGAMQWATSTNSAVGSGIRTFLGLTPIIGAATLATGSFLTAATKIGSVMATVGTAMKAMFLSPIGLSVIAIAALIGIFVSAYNSSANFKKTIDSLAASLSQSLAPAIQFAQQTIGIFVKGTVAAFNSIVQQMSTMASGLKNGLDFSGLGDSVIGFVSQVVNVLTIAKNAVFDFIKGFLQTDAIKSTMKAIGAVVQAVGSIIEQVVVSAGKLFSSLGDSGSSISTFQTLGSVVGNIVSVIANAVTHLAGFITYLTQLKGFNDIFTSLALGVGGVAIAFKVIATVVGIVTKSISIFNTVVGIGRGVMLAFNSAIAANPIGMIVIAIIAAVAAIVYFFAQTKTGQELWAKFAKFMSGVWDGIKKGVAEAGKHVSDAWQSSVDAVKGVWDSVTGFFQGIWDGIKGVWNGVTDFFSGIWNGIMETLQPVFTFVSDGWSNLVANITGIWNGIIDIATGVWNLIKDAVMGPILLLLDLITGNFKQLGIDAQNIWNDIVNNISIIWNGIVSIATTIFDSVFNTIANVWKFISDTTVTIWNTIVSTVTGIWNGFINGAVAFGQGLWNGIVNVWNAIPGWISGLWNGVKNVVSGVWNGIANTVVSLARSAWNGLVSAWNGAINWVSGLWNGVRSAVHNAMNFDLWGAGQAIMQSFLDGLNSIWGNVKKFISFIATWIRDHKGPISYDRKLLIPAGKAIMDGFGGSLNANFATVKRSVSSYAGQIADEFGDQQYVANAQLTTSSTGVAGQINGGLSALSDKVAEQQTQAPVFQVFNEIIGDKITTTVNTKNARRQATAQLMSGGV